MSEWIEEDILSLVFVDRDGRRGRFVHRTRHVWKHKFGMNLNGDRGMHYVLMSNPRRHTKLICFQAYVLCRAEASGSKDTHTPEVWSS